jgi:hypothetical protein
MVRRRSKMEERSAIEVLAGIVCATKESNMLWLLGKGSCK